jgi:hypothetical protein
MSLFWNYVFGTRAISVGDKVSYDHPSGYMGTGTITETDLVDDEGNQCVRVKFNADANPNVAGQVKKIKLEHLNRLVGGRRSKSRKHRHSKRSKTFRKHGRKH